MLTEDSCKDRECFSCRPCQFAVASEEMFVASVAETVPAAVLGNRKTAELPAAAFAEAFAAERFAVGYSGRTGSIAAFVMFVVVAAGLAAENHYHNTLVALAVALATALSGY